jgi:hypothetical protein
MTYLIITDKRESLSQEMHWFEIKVYFTSNVDEKVGDMSLPDWVIKHKNGQWISVDPGVYQTTQIGTIKNLGI